MFCLGSVGAASLPYIFVRRLPALSLQLSPLEYLSPILHWVDYHGMTVEHDGPGLARFRTGPTELVIADLLPPVKTGLDASHNNGCTACTVQLGADRMARARFPPV